MKKAKILLVTFLMCAAVLGAYAPAYAANSIHQTLASTASAGEIRPYADIIEWRYKVIDGKLYKRQYNASKGEWIGGWILVH